MWSQSTITSVNPPIQQQGMLFLSWVGTFPTGGAFQVYVNAALAWHGVVNHCAVPVPVETVRIDIGAVGPGEELTNFASSLPVLPRTRTELSWVGGAFESPAIAGFYVYGEATPGGGIDYTKPLATIAAYPVNIQTTGWNLSPWNIGPWGNSPSFYSWTSGPLASGTWNWAVVPFDQSGNQGPPAITSDTICAPPIEPAPFPDRTRLHYTFASDMATLTWNPSPSFA
jgi:hypothetical protein